MPQPLSKMTLTLEVSESCFFALNSFTKSMHTKEKDRRIEDFLTSHHTVHQSAYLAITYPWLPEMLPPYVLPQVSKTNTVAEYECVFVQSFPEYLVLLEGTLNR